MFECLVALCALEWLLSHVGPLMFLQVASYWEDLVILWAFKRLLSRVGLVPRWVCWEALVTLCALEWLFSCLGPHVPSSGQLIRLISCSIWKSLSIAIATLEWPLLTLRLLLSQFCDLILPGAECWMAKLQLYGSGKKIKRTHFKREIRECVRTVSFL